MWHNNAGLMWRTLAIWFGLILNAGAQIFPTAITTVAGGGSPDNVPATSSPFTPFGVAVDVAGNVLICESRENRVSKVDLNGIITTVSGNGTSGFSGDNGPAKSASLSFPVSVAVDSVGNLFIADGGNGRIRKVDTNGIITTVAGNGTTASPGDGGPATSASLIFPNSIAIDTAGNLFISDGGASRIRKVDTNGIITTVAGNGTAGFSGDNGPATKASLNGMFGVAVDGTGNIFIADTRNSRIRKVDTSGTITTVVGNGTAGFSGDNGPATSASINFPFGVAVDSAGDLVISDSTNNRVRKVDTSGIITTAVGNGVASFAGDGGPATSASIDFPDAVAVDGKGNLLISDRSNNRVRKVDHVTQVITTVAGNGNSSLGDSGPATQAALNSPNGVAVDGAGNLFIADTANNLIRKVDASGTITTVGHASLGNPFGLAADSAGNLFIADTLNHSILKVDTNGNFTTVAGNGVATFAGDGGLATSASLSRPEAVAVDGAGNLFIADTNNSRVRKVDTGGIITTVAGNGAFSFAGDGGAATNAGLSAPSDVAVDGKGNLYIADNGNKRVRKVNTGGVIETVAGNGSADSGDGGPATSTGVQPAGVRVDNEGNLFVADSPNNRIRKVDAAGIISTVAGNGVSGFSGDGGPATSASLASPNGLAVDSTGNIFIADTMNNRIRKVFTPPDFIIASSPSSASIKAGQTATFTLTITPRGGFNSAVLLSCSGGLPALSSCVFTLPSVTPNGSQVTATVVVKTTGPNAAFQAPALSREKSHPLFALWMLTSTLTAAGVVIVLPSRRRCRRDGLSPMVVALGLLLLGMSLAICGCGSGKSALVQPLQTPLGTSTITVTAAANGSTIHTTTVSLTVTQ